MFCSQHYHGIVDPDFDPQGKGCKGAEIGQYRRVCQNTLLQLDWVNALVRSFDPLAQPEDVWPAARDVFAAHLNDQTDHDTWRHLRDLSFECYRLKVEYQERCVYSDECAFPGHERFTAQVGLLYDTLEMWFDEHPELRIPQRLRVVPSSSSSSSGGSGGPEVVNTFAGLAIEDDDVDETKKKDKPTPTRTYMVELRERSAKRSRAVRRLRKLHAQNESHQAQARQDTREFAMFGKTVTDYMLAHEVNQQLRHKSTEYITYLRHSHNVHVWHAEAFLLYYRFRYLLKQKLDAAVLAVLSVPDHYNWATEPTSAQQMVRQTLNAIRRVQTWFDQSRITCERLVDIPLDVDVALYPALAFRIDTFQTAMGQRVLLDNAKLFTYVLVNVLMGAFFLLGSHKATLEQPVADLLKRIFRSCRRPGRSSSGSRGVDYMVQLSFHAYTLAAAMSFAWRHMADAWGRERLGIHPDARIDNPLPQFDADGVDIRSGKWAFSLLTICPHQTPTCPSCVEATGTIYVGMLEYMVRTPRAELFSRLADYKKDDIEFRQDEKLREQTESASLIHLATAEEVDVVVNAPTKAKKSNNNRRKKKRKKRKK